MNYYRKLSYKRFTVGLFLTAVGIALILSSLIMKWEHPEEDQYAALRKVRVEHVERQSCTYFLEHSFLLRNPSSKTMVDLVYVWIPVNESHQFSARAPKFNSKAIIHEKRRGGRCISL